jgi:hypothetical protein
MKDNYKAMVMASFVADSLALGVHWVYNTHVIDRKFGRVEHLENRSVNHIMGLKTRVILPITEIRPWYCWNPLQSARALISSVFPKAGGAFLKTTPDILTTLQKKPLKILLKAGGPNPLVPVQPILPARPGSPRLCTCTVKTWRP